MDANPDLFFGVHSCRRCPLHETRETNESAVPAAPGENYGAGGLAFVAQSPGADEALAGAPLVGRAGKCCQQLAAAAGIEWDSVLKSNIVRCRPPFNRLQDYPDAVVQCGVWTQQELRWYDPAVVVLFGNDALQQVFGEKARVTYTRGTVRATGDGHPWGARCFVATWHPSAVLRNGGVDSEMGQQAIADLELAKWLTEPKPLSLTP